MKTTVDTIESLGAELNKLWGRDEDPELTDACDLIRRAIRNGGPLIPRADGGFTVDVREIDIANGPYEHVWHVSAGRLMERVRGLILCERAKVQS